MRSFIVMAMFIASFADAAWKDYSETRDFALDAEGIPMLRIDAGAGAIDVRGVDGLDRITVSATIFVGGDEEKARSIIEKKMKLFLEPRGDHALLVADFKNGIFGGWSDARIDLEVSVPRGMALDIDDGSGSIDVVDIAADVRIDDGSGSIDLDNVANIVIDDGSGSIDVSNASGDVVITDGSGSIAVRTVGGSVRIDDGSGSINVSDVENDLVIVDDGSGDSASPTSGVMSNRIPDPAEVP